MVYYCALLYISCVYMVNVDLMIMVLLLECNNYGFCSCKSTWGRDVAVSVLESGFWRDCKLSLWVTYSKTLVDGWIDLDTLMIYFVMDRSCLFTAWVSQV